jgi:phage shock protein PspC (stress-responsive transcriptional regulator)/predicted membrane protein
MTAHATYKKLERSRSDRMAAGVCGGLGRYFDVNPTFYRVGFAVLTLLGGAGILIYLAAVLVIPDEGKDESIIEEALREHRRQPMRLIAIGVVAVAATVLLSHASLWPHGDLAWVLLLLAGLALLVSQRGGSSPTPTVPEAPTGTESAPLPAPRRSFPITLAVIGLLVVQTGIFAALASWGVDIPWAVAFAIEAVTAGAVLIAGAFMHQRVGGLVVIAVLLATVSVIASTIDFHLGDGIGDRTFTPATAAAVRDDYRLGIGDLQIDLSRVPLRPGETTVQAHVGIGHLLVIVPEATSIRVESHVGWGDSEVLGETHNGHDVNSTLVRGGDRATTLVIDAHVGAGQVEVERAPS